MCEFTKGLGQAHESAENLLSRRQFSQSHQGLSLQQPVTDPKCILLTTYTWTYAQTGGKDHENAAVLVAGILLLLQSRRHFQKQTLILKRPAVQSNSCQSTFSYAYLT